jgi:predicted nucleic acid-binding protein
VIRQPRLFGFAIYDALIIAAALESECATLYSEDFQSDQLIEGRLTIRNPFVN